MKKLFFYIAFEFRTLYWKLLAVAVLLLGLQNLLFHQAIDQAAGYSVFPVRFEELMASFPCSLLFYVALVLSMGLGVLLLLRDSFRTKSMYTLLTVPVPRSIPFAAKLLATLLGVLTVYTVQLLSVCLFYAQFVSRIPEEARMHNGLYLAFLRSDFLAALFPLSPDALLVNLLTVVCVAMAIFYAVLVIQHRRLQGFLLMVWLYLCIRVMNEAYWLGMPVFFRLGFQRSFYTYEAPQFYVSLALLVVCSGLMTWLGYRIYRSGDA